MPHDDGRPPRSLPWHLPRPELERRLLESGPLVVVRAPAGTGKSLLAAKALRASAASGGRTSWVDVSRHPARDEIVRAVRDVGTAGRSFLVLDSYDDREDPGTDEDVLEVLEHAPDLQVVATCRVVTGLESPTAEIRLGVQVLEGDALALDEESVRAMAALSGVTLDDRATARVLRVTGGTAATVRALLVADARGNVRLNAAVDRTLLEIAATTATDLAALADGPQTLRSWQALAVPDTVPRELGRRLVGTDAPAATAAAQEAGIGAWSADREVFVLTPVARYALRERLRRDDPRRAEELLERLADAALRRGDYFEGLRAAVLRRDYDAASRIVLVHWSQMARLDPGRTIRIMEDVPRGELLRHPYLALVSALCFNALPGRRARTAEHLALLVAAVARRLPRAQPGERAVLLSIESVGLRMLGQAGRAAAVARRAVAALEAAGRGTDPDVDLARPAVTLQLASSLFADGDAEGAAALAGSVDVDEHDPTDVSALRTTRVAFFAAMSGRVADARAELSTLPPDDDVEHVLGPYRASTARLARAVVALEDQQLDRVDELLRGLDLEMETNEFWPVHVLLDATADLLREDPVRSLATLARARGRPGRGPASYWLQSLGALEATALLATDQPDAAMLHLARLDQANPAVRAATARTRLAVGDTAAALESTGVPTAVPAGRFVETDLRLVFAASAARRGDNDVARRELSVVLRPGTTRLPWMFVAAEDRERLASVADHDPELSRAVATLPHLPVIVPVCAPAVLLTEREQVVLQGLAEGLGGPELAARLHVTLHTVKSQTRTLYRKLGVGSRADALVVARRRGLL